MTRIALFATAAAAAALALPAFAQEAVPAQPPVAATAAPAEPAAAPAQTAPAAEAPAQTAAAEPPPVLPTTGDGAIITSLLSSVCQPLVAGGNFEKLVKAQKAKLDNKTGEWVIPLSQKPFQVGIIDPGSNNKGVCDLRVRYAVGWDKPIVDSLNIWRFLQTPQLHGKRSDQANYTDVQRVTTTWDNWENQMIDGKMIGLVLVQVNKLDGTPSVNPAYDEAVVKFQVRAAQAGEGVASVTPAPAAAQPAG